MVTRSWHAVATLVDPVRRALYDYVRSQDHPVSREEAAEAQRISRNLAAHHLDKLVDATLLRAHYRAPTGRPRGRGRTPKLYEPADDGVVLSVPERRYDLIGEILTDAVAEAPDDARTAACRIARRIGQRTGRQAAEPATSPADLAAACETLAECGFAPRQSGRYAVLDNCPFHALAQRQPELICAVNLALVDGLLDGLGAAQLRARLAPRPGACCVQIDQVGGDAKR
ncbi:MAG: helix-turn-helix transcriptional regulator [Micromonosporaceae bacterium]